MQSDLKIDRKSLTSGDQLPSIYVRNYSINSNELHMVCCMERALQYDRLSSSQRHAMHRNAGFKFVLITDESLASSIVNRKISLSADLNNVKGFVQKIHRVFPPEHNLYTRKDVNYNLIQELTFPLSFEFPFDNLQGNPDYLAVAAFPFLTGKTANDTKFDRYYSIGNINFDVIFQNSKRVLENHTMVNSCGDHWIGRYEKELGSSFVAGAADDRIELTAIRTPNFKVQDNRLLKNLSNRFENINSHTNAQEERQQYDNKRATFGNLWTSLDSDRNVRFAFAIDCGEIYLNNVASLANFTITPGLLNNLRKYVNIRELRFYRHSETTAAYQMIVSAADTTSGVLMSSTYEQGAANDTKGGVVGSIKEVSLQPNTDRGGINEQVRFFTGTDYLSNFEEALTGTYFYEVQLEFENNVGQWFTDMVYDPLAVAHKKIKDYVALIESTDGEWKSTVRSRFKQAFVDTNREGYRAMLAGCIKTYINALSLIADVSADQQKEIANSMAVGIYPMSGNLDGCFQFLAALDKLLSTLASIKDLFDESTLSDDTTQHDSDTQHMNNTNTFTVKKFFDTVTEKLTVDCLNNTGINYIFDVNYKVNDIGLATLTKTYWQHHLSRAASNYPGTEVSYSYLPPAYVQSGGNVINLYQQNITQINYIGFDALMKYREDQREGLDVDLEYYHNTIDSEEAVIEQLTLTNAGDSLQVQTLEEAQNVLNSGFVQQAESQDALESGYTAGATDFGTSEPEEQKQVELTDAELDATQEAAVAASGVLAELAAGTNNLDQLNASFNLQGDDNIFASSNGDTSGLPSQLVALAKFPKPEFVSDNPGFHIDGTNKSRFNIEYNLQLLRAFFGFGSAGIKDEIWGPLQAADLGENRALLVHLAGTYTNSELGIEDKYASCPAFHEYFIIGEPGYVQSPSITAFGNMLMGAPRTYPEFTNSLPEYMVTNRPVRAHATSAFKQGLVQAAREQAANRGAPAGFVTGRRKGNTSFNANHHHVYEVDENGNGTAHEVCHPDHPEVCHSHKIVNWVVMYGNSAHHEDGIGSHVHNLSAARTGGASRTATGRMSTAPRTRASSGRMTGGSGTGGSGGSSY